MEKYKTWEKRENELPNNHGQVYLVITHECQYITENCCRVIFLKKFLLVYMLLFLFFSTAAWQLVAVKYSQNTSLCVRNFSILKKFYVKRILLILHLTKQCTPFSERNILFLLASRLNFEKFSDGIFICLKCFFGSVLIHIYNHNWDFLHSFEFFFSHFPCYWNNSSWLHFYLCSCSQPVFFHCICTNCSTNFLFFQMPRDCVSLDGYTKKKNVHTMNKKNYGMSNVNQARAFGMQYSTIFNVIMVIVVEALLLHYNLLPRNYKLFVVSDMSQFQHSPNILKTTESFALNLDATNSNGVIFFSSYE